MTVRVRVRNAGSRRLPAEEPALLVGTARVRTDPGAVPPAVRIGPLGAGETANLTLRFEVAGAIARQLRTERQARIVLARRSVAVAVAVDAPVRPAGTIAAAVP